MPWADLDSVHLYYEVVGDGPPLLFIAGSTGDLRTAPRSLTAPLEHHATVARYDHRGTGRSTVPAGPYAIADYAADAAGLIRHLEGDPSDVVGFSFGGMVAQELAIAFPEVVRRLVLISTSSGGAGGSSHPLTELDGLEPHERASRHLALADTRYRPGETNEYWQPSLSYLTPATVDAARERARRWQRAARTAHDAWERLGKITAPTLVCCGRFDGISPVRNHERLAGAIPNATLACFDGGHLMPLQTSSVHDAIADFLSHGAADSHSTPSTAALG